MIANNVLRVCFAFCIVVFSNAYGESGSHCKHDEKVFFSCPIGKKTVSYCESKADGADKYLEYRYGKPNKIELTYN